MLPCPRCGKTNRITNECGCDPDNKPTPCPYCLPNNAGLASETKAVCKRLAKLIQGLDEQINAWIVSGAILDDLRAFRKQLCDRLEAEGWTWSYSGTDRLTFREPGHKKPFTRPS